MLTPTPTELEASEAETPELETAEAETAEAETPAPALTPSEASKLYFAEAFRQEAPVVEVSMGSHTVFERLIKLADPITLHQRPAPANDSLDGEALNAAPTPIATEFSAVIARITEISSNSMVELNQGKTTVQVTSLIFINENGDNVEAELKQTMIPGSTKLAIRPFSGLGTASKTSPKGLSTKYMLDDDEKHVNRVIQTLMKAALENPDFMHFFNTVPKSLSQQGASASPAVAPQTNLD
jgi:hypothetical protein